MTANFLNELFSLSGKTALVTGASGYLGRSIAISLAKSGAKLILHGRSETKINKLVEEFKGKGFEAEPLIFDLTEENETKKSLAKIQEQPINIIVNNAYSGTSGTILSSSINDYRASYEVSLVGMSNLVQILMPALRVGQKQKNDASIINIASMYGIISPDQRIYDNALLSNPPHYGASKAALIQWTKYAACEFGKEGIRVNCISPGPFPNENVKKQEPHFIKKLTNKVPLGRVAVSEEIQGAVVFLASSASSFVTGTNVVIDGGWTAW